MAISREKQLKRRRREENIALIEKLKPPLAGPGREMRFPGQARGTTEPKKPPVHCLLERSARKMSFRCKVLWREVERSREHQSRKRRFGEFSRYAVRRPGSLIA